MLGRPKIVYPSVLAQEGCNQETNHIHENPRWHPWQANLRVIAPHLNRPMVPQLLRVLPTENTPGWTQVSAGAWLRSMSGPWDWRKNIIVYDWTAILIMGLLSFWDVFPSLLPSGLFIHVVFSCEGEENSVGQEAHHTSSVSCLKSDFKGLLAGCLRSHSEQVRKIIRVTVIYRLTWVKCTVKFLPLDLHKSHPFRTITSVLLPDCRCPLGLTDQPLI